MPEIYNRGFKPYTKEELEKIHKTYEEFRRDGYLSTNGSLKRGAIKIGAFYAIIPPSRLSVFERSDNQVISTLRQPGNIKLKQARLDTTIQVELVFPDLESINNNFRPILAQFIRAPFVPIDNYHLNMLLNPSVKWDIESNVIQQQENNGIITRTFKDDYIDDNNVSHSRAFTEYINNAVLKKLQEERKQVDEKIKELSKEIKELTFKIQQETDEVKHDELLTLLDIKTQKYNEYINTNVTNYNELEHVAQIRKDLIVSEEEKESEIYIVAMQNITVNNIPGYSQALQCTLTFNIMTSLPYSNDFSFLKTDVDFVKQAMYYSSRKYLRFPKSWRDLNNVTIYEEPFLISTTDLSKSEPFVNYLLPLLDGQTINKSLSIDLNNDNSLFNKSNIKEKLNEVVGNNLFKAKVTKIIDGDTIVVNDNITLRLYGVSAYETKHSDDVDESNKQLLAQIAETGLSANKIYEIGEKHRQLLSKYVHLNKDIYVKILSKDMYNRYISVLYTVNKINVNKAVILDSESSTSDVPSVRANDIDQLGLLDNIQVTYGTNQNWLRMVTNEDFNTIDMNLNIVELSVDDLDRLNNIKLEIKNLSDYLTLTFLQNYQSGNTVFKSIGDLVTIFGEDYKYITRAITFDVTRELLKETKIDNIEFEDEQFSLSKEYVLYNVKTKKRLVISMNESNTSYWTYSKLYKKFKEIPEFVNFMSNSSKYYKSFLELELRSKYGYQTNYHLPIGTSKDTVITGMTASMSHKMAPIWMQLYDYPIFQHMGRNDFAIELNLQTCDGKFLSALRDLSIKYNRNRRVRGKSQDAYFISQMNSIELPMDENSNGFFKVLGIGNVIPESVAMQTIPGKPGWFDVNMVLLQNDVDIQEVENLSWANEFNQDIINKATLKLMNDYVCKSNIKYVNLNNNFPFLTKNLFPPMRNFAFKHLASIFYDDIDKVPELSKNKEIISLDLAGVNYQDNSNLDNLKDLYKDLYNYKLPFSDDNGKLNSKFRIAEKELDYASGGFGYSRVDVNNNQRLHCGIDIINKSTKSSTEKGDDIYSNVDGKVVVNTTYTDFGNCVVIQKIINNLVFQFVYAHLAEKSDLQVGQSITKGTKIGNIGRTGKAFKNYSYLKAHLHYEVLLKVCKTKKEAMKYDGRNARLGNSSDFAIDPTKIQINNGVLQVYKISSSTSQNSKNNKEIIFDEIKLESFIPDSNFANYTYENIQEKLKYIIDDLDVEELYHSNYSGTVLYNLVKNYIYYTYNRNEKNPTYKNLLEKSNDYFIKANSPNGVMDVVQNNIKQVFQNTSNIVDTSVKVTQDNKKKDNMVLSQYDDIEKEKLLLYINYCRKHSNNGVIFDNAIQALQKTFEVKLKTAVGYYRNSISKFLKDLQSYDLIPVGETQLIQKYTNTNHLITALSGALHQIFNLNVPDYYNSIKKSLFRSLILKYIQYASGEFINWYNDNLLDDEKITLADLLVINNKDNNGFTNKNSNYADMELPYISGAYNSTTVDFYFKRFNDTLDFSNIEEKLNLYLDSAKNSWIYNNIKGLYLYETISKTHPQIKENINNIKDINGIKFKDGAITDNKDINDLINIFDSLSNSNALPDSNTSQQYIQWLKENSQLLESNTITKNNLSSYQFLYQFIDIIHLREAYKNLDIQAINSDMKKKLEKRYNNILFEQVNSLKSILLTPPDKLENVYTPYTMANYYDILNRLKMDYNNYKGRNRERCVESCFPTAKIYFIEEDNKSWQKLDDYYSYNSIEDIKVVKSAKSAADYCELTISNLSEVITNPLALYNKENVLEDNTAKEQQIDSLFLSEGTTIMVKLGYDNNPALLDRVFMGKIVSIEYGDRVHIKAQGFGAELHEPINNGLPDKLGFASSMKLYGDVVEYSLSTITSLEHFGARSVYEKLGLEDNYTGFPSNDRFNSSLDLAFNSIKNKLIRKYLPVFNLFKTIGTYDPRLENIYLSYSNSEALGYRILNNTTKFLSQNEEDLIVASVDTNVRNILNAFLSKTQDIFTAGYQYIKNLSDDIVKTCWRNDFSWVYPENYSFWDLLNEIKNYYPDYIVAILPYNDWIDGRQRDTIYLGPRKGYYKYTDIFDNSSSSQEFVNHIQNIREYERLIYNQNTRDKLYDKIEQLKKEYNEIKAIEDYTERYTKKQEFLKNNREFLYLLNIIFKKCLLINRDVDIEMDLQDPDLIYNINNVLDRFKKDIVLPEYIAKETVLDSATASSKTTNIKWRINNPDDLLDYDENGYLKEAFPQYQQVQNYYIVNSYSQIVSNNITASSEDIYNKLILTFPEDPTINVDKHDQSKEFYVSDAIDNSHTKTKIVHQNNIDPVNTIIPALTPFLKKWNADWSSIGELRYAYIPPETVVGYNILADSMRPMYRGTLELLGMSEIKPYDIIQINDIYNQMDGPIEVEQVIHHYSQNGFTTTIIPSAIINTKDPSITQELFLKQGFNLPIIGNVNGGNLLSIASNVSGAFGNIVSGIQSVAGAGVFVKNSIKSKRFQEYSEAFQSIVDKKIVKTKSNKINQKMLDKYKKTLSKKELELAKSNESTRSLFLQKRNIEKKIEECNKRIKDLRDKINKKITRFKDKSDKHVTEYYKNKKKTNNDKIENIKDVIKDEKTATQNEIKTLEKEIQELLDYKKELQTDLVDMYKEISADLDKQIKEEVKVRKNEIETIKKGNKAEIKELKVEIDKLAESNKKNDEVLSNIKKAQNNEKKLQELQKLLDDVNKDLEGFDKILASITTILLGFGTIEEAKSSLQPINSLYNILEDTTGLLNLGTGLIAGATGLARATLFPGFKLAAGAGLLMNPYTVIFALAAEVLFSYLNARLFNWGLGKVLGRNCIYVTPLNLNRTPMLAGLKGYNVYTDIETHINDEIYSLVNIPREYLTGLVNDDMVTQN